MAFPTLSFSSSQNVAFTQDKAFSFSFCGRRKAPFPSLFFAFAGGWKEGGKRGEEEGGRKQTSPLSTPPSFLLLLLLRGLLSLLLSLPPSFAKIKLGGRRRGRKIRKPTLREWVSPNLSTKVTATLRAKRGLTCESFFSARLKWKGENWRRKKIRGGARMAEEPPYPTSMGLPTYLPRTHRRKRRSLT